MKIELGRTPIVKNIFLYFALFMTLVILAACGATGGSTATVSDVGNVEGAVTDATTGNAIAGVTVQIGNQTVTTGVNGVYTLSNLTVGSRTITANKTGYLDYSGDVTIQKGTTVKQDIKIWIVGTKTVAALKINLTGTLPAATAISGAGFTITLPANVAPALTNGAVASGAVSLSGTFSGSTISPQVVYTAATATASGTLKVTFASSSASGVTQVDEVVTITLQLSNGATPTAVSFGLSGVSVVDTALYDTISGMGVNIGSVTLQ